MRASACSILVCVLGGEEEGGLDGTSVADRLQRIKAQLEEKCSLKDR